MSAKGINRRDILPLLWVFKYKFDNDGYLSKSKARICVRGDVQLSFKDTYAATLAFSVFRAIMAITAAYDLVLIQLHADNAFLNSDIDEEIYVRFPEGFEIPGMVLRLRKALYGLKRSPLLWHNTLSEALKTLGLTTTLTQEEKWALDRKDRNYQRQMEIYRQQTILV